MATLFVRKTGNDANSGASAVLAKLTLGSAFTAAANNDTIYVGAGTYRERNTTTKTGITLQGDVDGVQTGDSGEVIITGWASDTARNASDASTLVLGKDWKLRYLTVITANLNQVGGKFAVEMNQSGTVASGSIQDCTLIGDADNAPLKVHTNFSFSALNVTVERTMMMYSSDCVIVQCGSSASGADKDLNLLFRNCRMVCLGSGIAASGCIGITGLTNTFKSGGVRVYNCTIVPGHSPVMNTFGTSTSIPCEVRNCWVLGWSDSGNFALFYADVSGQIVEDYNLIQGDAGTGTTGVYRLTTAGTHSVTDESRALMISLGQEQHSGMRLRPAFTPFGPALGFGSDPAVVLTEDAIGRPRPAGGKSALKAVGALERHDTWVRETSTTHTGSNAVRCDGPGDQDFDVPVDAVSTTVKVFMQKDSTYAGTAPQFKVVGGSECGVADATATMTVAANTWEELTLTFTPTAQGVVTLRLQSNDTAGTGKAFADTRTGW